MGTGLLNQKDLGFSLGFSFVGSSLWFRLPLLPVGDFVLSRIGLGLLLGSLGLGLILGSGFGCFHSGFGFGVDFFNGLALSENIRVLVISWFGLSRGDGEAEVPLAGDAEGPLSAIKFPADLYPFLRPSTSGLESK